LNSCFVETRGLLPFSQELTTGLRLEPHESVQHPPHFSSNHFDITFSSVLNFSKKSLSFRILPYFYTNFSSLA